MATNYKHPGKIMPLTAPYDRTTGQGALVGALFGVATATVASGATGQFATTGVWTLTKATGEAWTLGALIYWDDTNKRCTTTATSNRRIGCAAVAAGSSDTTGDVRLNGVAVPTGA